jgi:uncharacterized protein YeaO (DUF488 family)
MAIRVVRLGSPRERDEGIRIGTVRRPPRGVRKEDYARLDYYDLWLPQLAPSEGNIKKLKSAAVTESAWKAFGRSYLRELSSPDNTRLLDLLAALSKKTDFSIGCYCESESRCHRSILREVLRDRGAEMR